WGLGVLSKDQAGKQSGCKSGAVHLTSFYTASRPLSREGPKPLKGGRQATRELGANHVAVDTGNCRNDAQVPPVENRFSATFRSAHSRADFPVPGLTSKRGKEELFTMARSRCPAQKRLLVAHMST